MVNRPRVLVVGSDGFIGGRLVRYLVGSGFSVVAGSRRDVATHEASNNLTILRADLCCLESLENACDGVDVVVNAAGLSSAECEKDPLLGFEINGFGPKRLLSAADSSGVKQLIQLSTVHVYSNNLIGRFSEFDQLLNDSPYAQSNRIGESEVLESISCETTKPIVLRLSNVVGLPAGLEMKSWDLVCLDLCKQAIFQKKLTVNSSRDVQRDFVSISFFCEAVSSLILNNDFINIKPAIINIASGSPMSLFELSSLVSERCESLFGYYPHTSFSKPPRNSVDLQFSVDRVRSLISDSSPDIRCDLDQILKYFHNIFGAA